ncbi:hypothetical protein KM176_11250 [Pseudooceanicola sp. CBS1P-1]|uniref:Uncharacterized protein n=1 Tax=Pseudooceanicola albus TaxID=2692189 RepID=A0A6L7GCZ6_9RHOB|nr:MULTISPECIES: hypothetical protein [Pseudooceanicola]MBT9384436.1 hypothetical protein [Pseudooceanicola endophyticus]MXN20663.1 hypothetical protein [Pseudooceanicola albus]
MTRLSLGLVLAASASLLSAPVVAQDAPLVSINTGPARLTGPKIIQGVAPGDVLPMNYMVLLGTERRGLPAPANGWVYFDVDGQVVKADLATREVIGKVMLEDGKTMMIR